MTRAHPAVPPPKNQRTNGYLYCRVCQRSWAYTGVDDPETWPKHRCVKNSVGVIHEFLPNDPNHTPVPWREPEPERRIVDLG